MDSQEARSAGYEIYTMNKALHLSDNRGLVRSSFIKSASSSHLASRGLRTTEDPREDTSQPVFDFVAGDTVLSSLLEVPEALARTTEARKQPPKPMTQQAIKAQVRLAIGRMKTNGSEKKEEGKQKSGRPVNQSAITPFRELKSIIEKTPSSAEKYSRNKPQRSLFQTSEDLGKVVVKHENNTLQRGKLNEARTMHKTTMLTAKSPVSSKVFSKVADAKTSQLLLSNPQKSKTKLQKAMNKQQHTPVESDQSSKPKIHERLYSLRNRKEKALKVQDKPQRPSNRLTEFEVNNSRSQAPVWKPAWRHTDREKQDSIIMTRTSDQKNNPRAFSSTASAEFFQRNLTWLQTCKERIRSDKEAREERELKECTFWPTVHQNYLHQPTPDLCWGVGSTEEEEHRVVIDGQTYELAKGGELQEFLLKAINKSGQRSIFRRSNETANRVYQQMLK